MIAALLALALAAPDAGTTLDAPWMEVRDGGTVVCMTEAYSVDLAGKAIGTEVTQKSEEKALLATDPAGVKIVLFTAGGFVVGAAVAAGVICAAVPNHCGLSPTPPGK